MIHAGLVEAQLRVPAEVGVARVEEHQRRVLAAPGRAPAGRGRTVSSPTHLVEGVGGVHDVDRGDAAAVEEDPAEAMVLVELARDPGAAGIEGRRPSGSAA